jgi:hypothetical protein
MMRSTSNIVVKGSVEGRSIGSTGLEITAAEEEGRVVVLLAMCAVELTSMKTDR